MKYKWGAVGGDYRQLEGSGFLGTPRPSANQLSVVGCPAPSVERATRFTQWWSQRGRRLVPATAPTVTTGTTRSWEVLEPQSSFTSSAKDLRVKPAAGGGIDLRR
jgi:hypothetical protein